MFESQELRSGIAEMFESFEPIDYGYSRRRFLPLAPEVQAGDLKKEAVWCRAYFDTFKRLRTRLLPRKRTAYARQWRHAHAEHLKAYRRAWRKRRILAGKRAW